MEMGKLEMTSDRIWRGYIVDDFAAGVVVWFVSAVICFFA